MGIPRKIIGLLALILLLGALPASGQSGKQETKKEPIPTTATSVRVSRPARVRIGGFVFGAGYSRFSGAFPYYSYFPYAYYRPWFHDAFSTRIITGLILRFGTIPAGTPVLPTGRAWERYGSGRISKMPMCISMMGLPAKLKN